MKKSLVTLILGVGISLASNVVLADNNIKSICNGEYHDRPIELNLPFSHDGKNFLVKDYGCNKGDDSLYLTLIDAKGDDYTIIDTRFNGLGDDSYYGLRKSGEKQSKFLIYETYEFKENLMDVYDSAINAIKGKKEDKVPVFRPMSWDEISRLS